MKKLLCLAFSIAILATAFAQRDSAFVAPFKRFPTVPPFRLLQSDSTTIFTKDQLKKNRPVLLMLFSPDCDHCKHETEEIIRKMDDFKKVQIVMATTLPFSQMTRFISTYDLNRFNNIVVGRDIGYMLPSYYAIRSFPFLALYDKKGRLIEGVEGSVPVEKLLAAFQLN